MTQIKGPSGTFTAHGDVADYWLAQPGYTAAVTAEEAAEQAEQLKGAALDSKLDELGLPDRGTADEKRAAVADALTNTDLEG